MSGRLTILPKKTYCPWKPENVERVLRDERLERERQQSITARTLEDDEDARRRRRRYDDGGHFNLFPEAKDAELKLLSGSRGEIIKSKSSSCDAVAEVLRPTPLGGDEAANRKSGVVPFYLRSSHEVRGKYDKKHSSSFRLGDNRAAGLQQGDDITGMIMRDQFATREDDRKEKMDPMSRFYVSCNTASTVYNHAKTQSDRKSHQGTVHVKRSDAECNINHGLLRQERTTRRKEINNSGPSKRDRNDTSSIESSSSGKCSLHSIKSENNDQGRERLCKRHSKRHKSHNRHRDRSCRTGFEHGRVDRREVSSKRMRRRESNSGRYRRGDRDSYTNGK